MCFRYIIRKVLVPRYTVPHNETPPSCSKDEHPWGVQFGLVGSSIRANNVGLKKSDAQAAEAALLVVYLQSILLELFFKNCRYFFNRLNITSTHSAIFSILKIYKGVANFDTLFFHKTISRVKNG